MYHFITSPSHNSNLQSGLMSSTSKPMKYQRYSSMDESQIPKNDWGSSSSKQPKIQVQKREAFEKRTHSQKKLSLTNTISSPIQSGTIQSPIIKSIQTPNYSSYNKNVQFNGCSKITLQKKGKYPSMKNSQIHKLNQHNINIAIQQASKEYQQEKTQRSRALIERTQNDNNYSLTNPEADPYKVDGYATVAAGNHFYLHNQPKFNNPNNSINNSINSTINNPINKPINNSTTLENQSIDAYKKIMLQSLQAYKDQTNKVLFENSMKIKQLQNMLVQNKQQLQSKNDKIKNLQLKMTFSPKQINSGNVQINSSKNIHFIQNKIQDVNTKLSILIDFYKNSEYKVDEKVQKLNNLLNNFVSVKLHNIKFMFKAFVSKGQKHLNQIQGKINKLARIQRAQNIQSYQILQQKTMSIVCQIEKMSCLKPSEKCYSECMKNTIHTSTTAQRTQIAYQESISSMMQSRSPNDSFWNTFQDFPVNQTRQQDCSFTDDSFSYAPNTTQTNASSDNSIPSSAEFQLGSFPSFSKVSIENSTKQQYLTSANVQAIQEIARFRQAVVQVYIDQNGFLRYSGSDSCIFDRKGNILKPTQLELSYCIEQGLLRLN